MTTAEPGSRLRVALLTREYPPEVYGGAGVHVAYLARELAGLVDLTVHCQGADRPGAVGTLAVHGQVDQPGQLAGEVGHVYPGPAVDLGRVLPGEQRHAQPGRCHMASLAGASLGRAGGAQSGGVGGGSSSPGTVRSGVRPGDCGVLVSVATTPSRPHAAVTCALPGPCRRR